MADFLILTRWDGRIGPSGVVNLPAGKVISDSQYDVARLLASGLRAIQVDAEVADVLREDGRGLGDVAAAALETLFPRSIPPAVISPIFAMYFVSASAQTIMNPGTPVKMAGTTTAVIATGLTHSNNRLTNSGSKKITVGVNAAMTLESTANNRIVSGFLAKNGAVISGTEIRTKVGTGTDEEELTVFGIVELDPTDFVEVFLDINAAGDLTATLATIMAQGFDDP